ncbi:MAG TPA: RNase adapter RapZ [Phycisphaerales bacterium]|nr:RNase adapter RapZ [Phycisphaerales bacterium]
MSRELWIVTGLSGAGKSLALKSLEDLGFWCVDNLPCALMKPYIELEARKDVDANTWRALGLRGIEQIKELRESLKELPEESFTTRILFLECDEATLVKRYSESRRRHPLISEGLGLLKALKQEREALQPIRERADYVIDTSNLSPHALMIRLESIQTASSGQSPPLLVHIQSFGFKNGAPADAEWIWDMRFLPNPYYNPELRHRAGVEAEVRDAVFSDKTLLDWVETQIQHFLKLLPMYSEQGRRQLNLAIGCTGGQHRSVATLEKVAGECLKLGYVVSIHHRDTRLRPELEGERSRFLLPSQTKMDETAVVVG